jgi:hypothetical protein
MLVPTFRERSGSSMISKMATLAVCLVAACTFSVLGMAACGSAGSVAEQPTVAQGSATVDHTSTTTPKESTVVLAAGSSAAFTHFYHNVDEFIASDQTELIIQGRVVAYRDVLVYDQSAFRVLEVEVEHSFKGKSASKVYVYDEGGIIPLKDALPVVGAHINLSTLTEEQLADRVVDFRPQAGEHLKVGDEVVMFLYRNVNKVPEEVSYQVVMSAYGRYTLDPATGQYVRPDLDAAPGGGWETHVSAREMEAKLAPELVR